MIGRKDFVTIRIYSVSDVPLYSFIRVGQRCRSDVSNLDHSFRYLPLTETQPTTRSYKKDGSRSSSFWPEPLSFLVLFYLKHPWRRRQRVVLIVQLGVFRYQQRSEDGIFRAFCKSKPVEIGPWHVSPPKTHNNKVE